MVKNQLSFALDCSWNDNSSKVWDVPNEPQGLGNRNNSDSTTNWMVSIRVLLPVSGFPTINKLIYAVLDAHLN